jgi:hypothetical protein
MHYRLLLGFHADEGAARMRERQNKDKNRVVKTDGSRTSVEHPKGKDAPRQDELSVQETKDLYSGLEEGVEVRIAGLFRASGNSRAVVALATLAGFLWLASKGAIPEACLLGGLGAWLVWMMISKGNAKS